METATLVLEVHIFTYILSLSTKSLPTLALELNYICISNGRDSKHLVVPLHGNRPAILRGVRTALGLLRLVGIVLDGDRVLRLCVRDAALLALHRPAGSLALALIR